MVYVLCALEWDKNKRQHRKLLGVCLYRKQKNRKGIANGEVNQIEKIYRTGGNRLFISLWESASRDGNTDKEEGGDNWWSHGNNLD